MSVVLCFVIVVFNCVNSVTAFLSYVAAVLTNGSVSAGDLQQDPSSLCLGFTLALKQCICKNTSTLTNYLL